MSSHKGNGGGKGKGKGGKGKGKGKGEKKKGLPVDKVRGGVPCSAYAYSLVNNKPPKCLDQSRWNGGLNCGVNLIHHKFEFELKEWHTAHQEKHKLDIEASLLIQPVVKTIVLGDERYEWCAATSVIYEGVPLQLVPCSMRHEIEPSEVRDFGYLGAASYVSTAESIAHVNDTFGSFDRFIFLGYASLTNALKNQQASLFDDHAEYFEPFLIKQAEARHKPQTFEDMVTKDPEKVQKEKDMFMLSNFKINRAVFFLKKLQALLVDGGEGILIDESYVVLEIFNRLHGLKGLRRCYEVRDFDYLSYPMYYPVPGIGSRSLKILYLKPIPEHPTAVAELLNSLIVDDHFFAEGFLKADPKHPKPHTINFSQQAKGLFSTGGICTDPKKSSSDPMFDRTSINQETQALKNRLAQKRAKTTGTTYQPPLNAPPKKRVRAPVAVLVTHIDVDADDDDVKKEPHAARTDIDVDAEDDDVKKEPRAARTDVKPEPRKQVGS